MNSDPLTRAEVESRWGQALTGAYRTANREAQQARAHLYGLTPSAVGKCPRQAAYRLAGATPSDPRLAIEQEARAALHGTWIHAGLLPHLASALGDDAEYEKPVTLHVGDTRIEGTLDAWDPTSRTVGDLKTARDSIITRIAGRDQPPTDHRLQVGAYALGMHQAGHRVDWVVWLYLDRTSGDLHPVAQRWTRGFARDVLEACWRIQRDAEDPDGAARGENGPGLSVVCDSCPWLRRCWGAAATPGETGAQATVVDDRGAEFWVGEYVRTREARKRAEEEHEFTLSVVRSLAPAVYGGWRLVFSRPGETVDIRAAKEKLAENGLDVPVKAGSSRPYVHPTLKHR